VIGVILAAIIAAAIVWYLLRRREQMERPDKLQAANLERDKRASAQGLRLGDVVNYEGSEFVVQGSIHYRQGGSTWDEHLLLDGTKKKWLSVEDDEGIEIAVWEKLVDPDIQPGEKRILYGGHNYTLEEQGQADYTAEGTTGTGTSGKYHYADYESGELRLTFERYATEAPWELSTGRVIPEAALDIYPASEPSA
jgi:hypothetical protein